MNRSVLDQAIRQIEGHLPGAVVDSIEFDRGILYVELTMRGKRFYASYPVGKETDIALEIPGMLEEIQDQLFRDGMI